MIRPILASGLLAFLCACASERASTLSSAPSASAAPPAAAAAPDAAWKNGTSVLSNAGRYRVVFEQGGAEWPRGKPFGFVAWVFDARTPDVPLTDVALTIDAAMPDHQHGMNRVPTVLQDANGKQQIEGVLFHMPGYWELYFDITRGAHVERAQVGFEVE
ncbi:MAG: hypothetical protein ACKVWV_08750 [Planctomycetota bacterium]